MNRMNMNDRERRIYDDEMIRQQARSDYNNEANSAGISFGVIGIVILIILAFVYSSLNDKIQVIIFVGMGSLMPIIIIYRVYKHFKIKNHQQMLINQKIEEERQKRVAARKYKFFD